MSPENDLRPAGHIRKTIAVAESRIRRDRKLLADCDPASRSAAMYRECIAREQDYLRRARAALSLRSGQ